MPSCKIERLANLSAAKNMSRNPLLLHAIPRSGSTILYKVLDYYFRQHAEIHGLGEYFEISYHKFFEGQNGLIEIQKGEAFESSKALEQQDLYQTIINQRFEWAQKYYGRYFFKLMTNQFLSRDAVWLQKIHGWLWERFDWIFVERRNTFEHLLSFLVSSISNQWYEVHGIRLNKGSLKATPELIEEFQKHYFNFQVAKRKKNPQVTWVFEDFLADPNPQSFLSCIGLNTPTDFTGLTLPKKQNVEDKLSLFINPEFILNEYRRSSLYARYRI
jgi:hypothetical protein